jgi:hypothetical protein
MLENYELLDVESLKHLCLVTFHAKLFKESNNYLNELILKEKMLDKNFQRLLVKVNREILIGEKLKIEELEREYKKLYLFSKTKKKKNSNEEEEEDNKNKNEQNKVNYTEINIKDFVSSFNKSNEDDLIKKKLKEKEEKSSKKKRIPYDLDPEKNKDLIAHLLTGLREIITNKKEDLQKDIHQFIYTISSLLVKNAKNSEDLIFYYKVLGDFSKYESELYKTYEANKRIVNAEKYFCNAINLSNNISFQNKYKLAVYLNYAVFLYEKKKDLSSAMSLLNKCINENKNNFKNMNDDESKKIYLKIIETKDIWEKDPIKFEEDNEKLKKNNEEMDLLKEESSISDF